MDAGISSPTVRRALQRIADEFAAGAASVDRARLYNHVSGLIAALDGAAGEADDPETTTRESERPMTDSNTPGASTMPYLLESASFLTGIQTSASQAQTLINTIDTEIDQLNAEIEARMTRRQDLSIIVSRAAALLNGGAVNQPVLTDKPATAIEAPAEPAKDSGITASPSTNA